MTNQARAAGPLGASAIAGAGLLAACAAPAALPPEGTVVRFYAPPEIIVPTGNVGRFEAARGCIFFRYETLRSRRDPALFPQGTRLSEDRRRILLPNGRAIPFGAAVRIVFEAPPDRTGLDGACGPRPIQVLDLAERG